MTPIARVAWGYVAVALDLRLAGVDVVPDLLGWLVALWGLWSLAGLSRWFAVAGAAGVGGLVLAVPALFAEPGPFLATLEAVVEAGLVFGVCCGLRAILPQARVRRTADGIRWLALGLTGLLVLLGLLTGFRPVESAWAIPWGIGAVVVTVWFLVFLFGLKEDPALRETVVGTARRTN